MKSFLFPSLFIVCFAVHGSGQEPIQLTNDQQRVSYAFGADIGRTLVQKGIELDAKAIAAGLEDSLTGETVLSQTEMRTLLSEFQQELMAKVQANQNKVAAENLAAGEAFLAENAKKEGVTVLPSGLQYKVLESGDGKTPTATDTVRTHYHGTLIDGTVFDSSVDRGEPVTFPVNGVIAGWTEALQLMKVGDKWRLFIPAELAYGETGAGGVIGPNSALIFDVELLAVE